MADDHLTDQIARVKTAVTSRFGKYFKRSDVPSGEQIKQETPSALIRAQEKRQKWFDSLPQNLRQQTKQIHERLDVFCYATALRSKEEFDQWLYSSWLDIVKTHKQELSGGKEQAQFARKEMRREFETQVKVAHDLLEAAEQLSSPPGKFDEGEVFHHPYILVTEVGEKAGKTETTSNHEPAAYVSSGSITEAGSRTHYNYSLHPMAIVLGDRDFDQSGLDQDQGRRVTKKIENLFSKLQTLTKQEARKSDSDDRRITSTPVPGIYSFSDKGTETRTIIVDKYQDIKTPNFHLVKRESSGVENWAHSSSL